MIMVVGMVISAVVVPVGADAGAYGGACSCGGGGGGRHRCGVCRCCRGSGGIFHLIDLVSFVATVSFWVSFLIIVILDRYAGFFACSSLPK